MVCVKATILLGGMEICGLETSSTLYKTNWAWQAGTGLNGAVHASLYVKQPAMDPAFQGPWWMVSPARCGRRQADGSMSEM
jgi:hypothetical protein